jgi:hypothetical protein
MNPTTLTAALSEIAKLKKDLAYSNGRAEFFERATKEITTMAGKKGSVNLEDIHFVLRKVQIDEPGSKQNN